MPSAAQNESICWKKQAHTDFRKNPDEAKSAVFQRDLSKERQVKMNSDAYYTFIISLLSCKYLSILHLTLSSADQCSNKSSVYTWILNLVLLTF